MEGGCVNSHQGLTLPGRIHDRHEGQVVLTRRDIGDANLQAIKRFGDVDQADLQPLHGGGAINGANLQPMERSRPIQE